MSNFWWALFIIAAGILLYILLRPHLNAGTFLRFAANLLIAGLIVYGVQVTGILGEVQIPINIPTVMIAGLLGIPGVALLYGVQLLVFN